MSKLNPKTLTVAAILLMVLALLVMAAPLLRTTTGFAGRTGSNQQFSPPGFSGQGGGIQGQAPSDGQNGQGFVFQSPGDGSQSQINPNSSGRQFQGRPGSGIFRPGFLNGVTGTIVYAIALLVSLAAAVGMFMTKRWGKVLGIIMAVLYGLLALVNLLPTLLISFMGIRNPLNLILGVVHLLLAIAVIVLASIPGKKPAAPITPAVPPTVPA
jgi:hypothetical protein